MINILEMQQYVASIFFKLNIILDITIKLQASDMRLFVTRLATLYILE